MSMTQKQINDLITGTELAAELPSVSPQNRRFVKIIPYELNERGKAERPDKILDSRKKDTVRFRLCDHEYPSYYIENDLEIYDGDVVRHTDEDDLIGIAELEERLSAILSDFSILVPAWETDDCL